jgi:hypothetical protein
MACRYYALKRINGYKNTKKAKELLWNMVQISTNMQKN